jgi:hypothetical protein
MCSMNVCLNNNTFEDGFNRLVVQFLFRRLDGLLHSISVLISGFRTLENTRFLNYINLHFSAGSGIQFVKNCTGLSDGFVKQ